jgi:hypothetical protein
MEDMREKFEKASRIFLETDIIKEEPKQKVVKPEEIDRYIESGWEFLSNLPDGRVVIKKE